jgi:hypothetical protein
VPPISLWPGIEVVCSAAVWCTGKYIKVDRLRPAIFFSSSSRQLGLSPTTRFYFNSAYINGLTPTYSKQLDYRNVQSVPEPTIKVHQRL